MKKKKFAQLYFVDSNLANEIRINNNQCNSNLLYELNNILRDINGYWKSSKMLQKKKMDLVTRIHCKGGDSIQLLIDSELTHPMTYPLLYPYGGGG